MKPLIAATAYVATVTTAAALPAAEFRIVHKALFAEPAFADGQEMMQQLPKPEERHRLYLCNTGGGLMPKQELTTTRQKPSRDGVWASIIPPEFGSLSCEWKGTVPDPVAARQIQLWLLLGTKETRTHGPVTLKVKLLLGDSGSVERDIELRPECINQKDGGLIELLERWNVDELEIKRNERVTIQFASSARGLSLIGYGLSHLTFRDTPQTPAPQTAVWLRTKEKIGDKPVIPIASKTAAARQPKNNSPTKTAVTSAKKDRPVSDSRPALSTTKRSSTSGRAMRMWTDSTGQYKVMAQFRGAIAGTVRLTKPSGETIEVAMDRLSLSDKHWIRYQAGR